MSCAHASVISSAAVSSHAGMTNPPSYSPQHRTALRATHHTTIVSFRKHPPPHTHRPTPHRTIIISNPEHSLNALALWSSPDCSTILLATGGGEQTVRCPLSVVRPPNARAHARVRAHTFIYPRPRSHPCPHPYPRFVSSTLLWAARSGLHLSSVKTTYPISAGE